MDQDVVVVGGGPTGLWLACELARVRVRVVILEQLGQTVHLGCRSGPVSRSDVDFSERRIVKL
jgi:2-polyprenyl-6-methoxyphenol hydroxylase-like FAD-dependent oxidoreductase